MLKAFVMNNDQELDLLIETVELRIIQLKNNLGPMEDIAPTVAALELLLNEMKGLK